MLIERWSNKRSSEDVRWNITDHIHLLALCVDLWPLTLRRSTRLRRTTRVGRVRGRRPSSHRRSPTAWTVFRVQGGHLVCWGHAVSSSRHASCWWWDTLTAGAGGRSQNSGSGQSRRSMFRPRPHNPALSIEFVLREAAALSFLTYNQKQNNA